MSKTNSAPSTNFLNNLKRKGAIVIEIQPHAKGFLNYSRKGFYKIALVTGKALINQAHEKIHLDGTYLRFSTPYIPYSSEVLSEKWEGYACYFLEEFLYPGHRVSIMQKTPLFKIGAAPAVKLTIEQKDKIASIFQNMLHEQSSTYKFKNDVLRSHINLLIHESIKIDDTLNFKPYQKAPIRITSRFFDLLEEQFPVVSPLKPIKLVSASDFAECISVHVNYLNRMVKDTTGKTTSHLIAERIIKEAVALLKQTDWTISEIALALGFIQSNYFSSFFKRHIGQTPQEYRRE
ncbi:AraC family transcriptional regulator [Euzebyella marina]|uniref:AraC family transcriptional regulator n=1 Tax=Euzebyella marina TaxID=1761453 RepID=A0A3G2L560_9FLAO|nr:helix-turn-helix transcriptional regulator [Euzebyella marina]AYN67392.1 AraC family transcriptional regulator [Euzebyella marina]